MVRLRFAASLLGGALLSSCLAYAAPGTRHDGAAIEERQSTGPLVFCHFMIGIVSDRTGPGDYDADMQRAKSLGIDAFALNIGTDPFTDQQLGYAYQSAANNGMKVFISFDFNWWHPTTDAAAVGQKIAQYAGQPAQLKLGSKVFASSFAGDGLDVATMRSAAGTDVFFAPNFHPGQSDVSQIDGALNWMAWDNNGNNKAPTPGANVTVEQGDASYQSWLNGKSYIAPVSAWFSTHFGPEVSYSKNWVFPGDLLWFRRWNDILAMKPPFLEIITWNDYGESHYIGPLSSKHTDDGNSKWTNDMPHDGWLDVAKPFIAAYHAGDSSVASHITADELVYWYRPTLRSLDCDATDTTMVPANNDSGNYFEGRPNGWEDVQDAVFVIALLTTPGKVTVTSGTGAAPQSFDAPAGATAFQVPMAVGPQSFSLTRGGQTVLSGTSLKEISADCVCGIYNFNAYVGSLPAGPSDPLGPDGLALFEQGLKVSTCQPTPSLGSAPQGNQPPPSQTPPATTTAAGTTEITTTSTVSSTTTVAGSAPSTACTAGTVAPGMSGNYLGLCSFSCSYGNCPSSVCICTGQGSPVPPPPVSGPAGCPLPGEADPNGAYAVLCGFTCSHGYCPPTACSASC